MLLMPETNKDFDLLGEKVANAFFTEALPLHEGVVKEASTLNLNVEETKRLAEKANTFASIKMVKASSDGKAEFELADINEILNETHGGPLFKRAETNQTPTKMPNSYQQDIFSSGEKAEFFKTASEENSTQKQFPLRRVSEITEEVNTFSREKVAEELKFVEGLGYLIDKFSNIYSPDFSKFASDAFSLYGETAVPILEELAINLKKEVALEKVAGVVDDKIDPVMVKFAEVQKAVLNICYYREKIASSKNDLKKAWRKSKRC